MPHMGMASAWANSTTRTPVSGPVGGGTGWGGSVTAPDLRALALACPHGRHLLPRGSDRRRPAQRARLRRVPRGRWLVAPPAPLHRVWPRGLLRFLAQHPRHQARAGHGARDRAVVRAWRGLVLVLRGRGGVRAARWRAQPVASRGLVARA